MFLFIRLLGGGGKDNCGEASLRIHRLVVVPQGSVLVPVPSLLHENDRLTRIPFETVVFGNGGLHQDIDRISTWPDAWLMEFNVANLCYNGP